jgi:hypothetical protein
MKRLLLAAIVALSTPAVAAAAPGGKVADVIFDQDGAVDDLVALTLLMKSGRAKVRAITITPGDSYLEPATRATQLFVDRLGGRRVTIAQGHSEGTNPFPAEWRKDAGRMLQLAALQGSPRGTSNPVVADDAAHHLAKPTPCGSTPPSRATSAGSTSWAALSAFAATSTRPVTTDRRSGTSTTSPAPPTR